MSGERRGLLRPRTGALRCLEMKGFLGNSGLSWSLICAVGVCDSGHESRNGLGFCSFSGVFVSGPFHRVLQQPLVCWVLVRFAIVSETNGRDARFRMLNDKNHREVLVF